MTLLHLLWDDILKLLVLFCFTHVHLNIVFPLLDHETFICNIIWVNLRQCLLLRNISYLAFIIWLNYHIVNIIICEMIYEGLFWHCCVVVLMGARSLHIFMWFQSCFLILCWFCFNFDFDSDFDFGFWLWFWLIIILFEYWN